MSWLPPVGSGNSGRGDLKPTGAAVQQESPLLSANLSPPLVASSRSPPHLGFSWDTLDVTAHQMNFSAAAAAAAAAAHVARAGTSGADHQQSSGSLSSTNVGMGGPWHSSPQAQLEQQLYAHIQRQQQEQIRQQLQLEMQRQVQQQRQAQQASELQWSSADSALGVLSPAELTLAPQVNSLNPATGERASRLGSKRKHSANLDGGTPTSTSASAAAPVAMSSMGSGPGARGGAGAGAGAGAGVGVDESEDPETKRKRRLEKNKINSRMLRQRQKMYIAELEARVQHLERENTQMREQVASIVSGAVGDVMQNEAVLEERIRKLAEVMKPSSQMQRGHCVSGTQLTGNTSSTTMTAGATATATATATAAAAAAATTSSSSSSTVAVPLSTESSSTSALTGVADRLHEHLNALDQDFSKFRKQRLDAISFHLQAINGLLVQLPSTKFLLWALRQGDVFFDTYRQPNGLFAMLQRDLSMTSEQRQLLEESRALARTCTEQFDVSVRHLKDLHGHIQTHTNSIHSFLKRLRAGFTPTQRATFLIQVEQNKALQSMLNTLIVSRDTSTALIHTTSNEIAPSFTRRPHSESVDSEDVDDDDYDDDNDNPH